MGFSLNAFVSMNQRWEGEDPHQHQWTDGFQVCYRVTSEIFNFLGEWKMFISLNPVCFLSAWNVYICFPKLYSRLALSSSRLQKLHSSNASSLGNGAAINLAPCTCVYSKFTCFQAVAVLVIQLRNPKCKPKQRVLSKPFLHSLRL